MATKKIAGPSPYDLKVIYPEDDYLHRRLSIEMPLTTPFWGLCREDLRKYWKLGKDVTFLTSKDANRVYKVKDVNVVFVGSPTYTHHDIVVNAIANNKDVFCEKPIAENVEDTKKCYESAKAKGRTLFAAFNRRFDPAYSSLKNKTRKGEVSHIQILKVRFSTYGYDQRLEVFGNRGMIKVENERPCHSVETIVGQEGINQTPIYYSFPSRYKLAYKRELEHFLDFVQDGAPIIVTSWQTLAVSKIATAAEESARTGKTIDLDWSKDDMPENYS